MLTGEIDEGTTALTDRATDLIGMLGSERLGGELQPSEIAACVTRALSLPDIVPLRGSLQPEFPVLGSSLVDGTERVVAGIADAVGLAADGRPEVVVDWKSDVATSRRRSQRSIAIGPRSGAISRPRAPAEA